MKENQLKVLIKEPNKEIEERTVADNLKNWQQIVGGYIETIPFPNVKNVIIVLNEEGKLKNLPCNFYIPDYCDMIVGNVAIVARKGSAFASLSDEQTKAVKKYIKSLEKGSEM